MVRQGMEILCGKHDLERNNSGILWLVGSRFMPYTVISSIKCLHFNDDNEGDPDLQTESADVRILLPRGLDIVGAVLNVVGGLDTIRRAGQMAFKLATLVWHNESGKPPHVIASCLEEGKSGLQFYIYTEADNTEAIDDVVYHSSPGAHLWKELCLVHSQLQLKVPVYSKSFSNPADYKAHLWSAMGSIVENLRSDALFCLVEGSAASKTKLIHMGSKKVDVRCSEFCSSDSILSPHGLQMPKPLTVKLMLHQSKRKGTYSAPCVEYLPVVGGALLRVLNLQLAAVCLVPQQFSIHEAITSHILPALADQLVAMRDTIYVDFVEYTKLCTYGFLPPGFIHPILCIYNISYGESESCTVDCRRRLHQRLSLPMDRPLLRIANAVSFSGGHDAQSVNRPGRARLCNVHINMPTGSGVVGGHCSIVQGAYEYYHYLQDNINDSGWGCAYRSLQTIFSWFRLQHYTVVDVPTHEKIQDALVEIGDKEPSFKGSQNWIGAIELSFVLDKLLGVSNKILNVRSGAEMPEKCRELALHFETQGTPVMIGGGVLAYTLLGVDYKDTTGDCAFLILDPHYTGGEDLKSIWAGGWCGWKKPVSAEGEEFFLQKKFYNLLLPQRPNMI